ncbi:MAG: LysM peptidoglycan-binding domain-containing protein [Muribaculaceae bacterium]|nr:LysM peptidoglycan-binding domain-containing protein [Muribaculaceae bacterium]
MKLIPTIIAIAAVTLSAMTASAGKNNPSVLDIKHNITDDAIIYPESFEIDTQNRLESWYLKNYTATDDRYRTLPDVEVSDEVIKQRLAAMPTVIEMPYNPIVRSYIDRYTKRSRQQVAMLLGLSIYYMPIFEQALEEEGLPLELRNLPVIESALNPNAVSRHGATGLWQFMLATAKGIGREVNSIVDERRDPYASSQKAAKYLHDLFDSYGDWSLAIAAYNCGPGTVNKAIRRAGGDPKSHDFWSIYNYLPAETRGYVPLFIAANYVMTYYPEHNISPVLPTKPLVTDTVHVARRIHLDQISNVLSIPIDELRILNPQFRADLVPGSADKPYTLILPSQQALAYVMSEDNISQYQADKYAQRIEVDPGADPTRDTAYTANGNDTTLTAGHPEDSDDSYTAATAQQQSFTSQKPTRTITHTVAAGETLSAIANRYKVTVSDIRSWNSLRRNAVRAGQKLRIQTSEDVADADNSGNVRTNEPATNTRNNSSTASTASNNKNNSQSRQSQTKKKAEPAAPSSHTIKSGENLTTIAKKYGVTVDELRRANNLKGDAIRAGASLKVPAKKASSGSSSKSSSSKRKSSSKRRR